LEISKYGKKLNENMKIIVFSLDDSKSKLNKLTIALKETIKTGGWIIIENPHLLIDWPNDLLEILYVI
jgi:hypothetical protein